MQKSDGTRKLIINLPVDWHKTIKRMAVDEDTTMTAIVRQWIEDRLNDNNEERNTDE